MKKEIRRIEIEPAENGGHTVTHHLKPAQRQGRHGMMEIYMEPEHHVFGADEGHEMLAHVANHLAIPEAEEPDEPEKDEGEEEEAEPGEARMTKKAAERVRKAVA
jgi:hypothetical protein